MAALVQVDRSRQADERPDWRDGPAWLATAAMLGSAVLLSWLGDETLGPGWGAALVIGAMAAIALLVRRITWDVFWSLGAANIVVKGVGWLFDTDGAGLLIVGAGAMIGVAYLVGDLPLRNESMGQEEGSADRWEAR